MSNTLKSISKHNLTKIRTKNIIKIKIYHYKKVKKLKLPLLSTFNKNLEKFNTKIKQKKTNKIKYQNKSNKLTFPFNAQKYTIIQS